MLFVQILLTILFIFVTRSGFKGNKFLRDVILFYVLLYSLQIIAAIADPYQYYRINEITVILFNLQIVFILIGATTALNRSRKAGLFDTERIFDFKINTPVLIIQTVFLLIVYNRYQRMSRFLLTAAMSNEARGYFFTEFYSSYTEMLLNQFLDSFLYISYFFAFGLIFFHKGKLGFKELYVVITTIIIVALNTLTSYGRMGIIRIVFVFALFFFLSRHFDRKIFKSRTIPFAAILVGVVVVVFALTTVVRSNLGDVNSLESQIDELVLKPFATYFYVPICAFEYGAERVFDDLVPMFGAADLAGVIEFLLTPIRFFIHSIPSPNTMIGARMTPGFYFPSGEGWNALFTGASNYYIDFGYFGFVVFPFIHGYMFTYLCKRSGHSGTWFLYFLWLFMCTFRHMSSSGIQSMDIMFFIIWVFVVRKCKAIT